MNLSLATLVAAIFRQEGGSPTDTNPGNLRDAPWFPVVAGQYWPDKTPKRKYRDGSPVDRVEKFNHGKSVGWFIVFRTREEGELAAAHVVVLRTIEEFTLAEVLSAWAPAMDGNNVSAYLKNVCTWCNVPTGDATTVPLHKYLKFLA